MRRAPRCTSSRGTPRPASPRAGTAGRESPRAPRALTAKNATGSSRSASPLGRTSGLWAAFPPRGPLGLRLLELTEDLHLFAECPTDAGVRTPRGLAARVFSGLPLQLGLPPQAFRKGSNRLDVTACLVCRSARLLHAGARLLRARAHILRHSPQLLRGDAPPLSVDAPNLGLDPRSLRLFAPTLGVAAASLGVADAPIRGRLACLVCHGSESSSPTRDGPVGPPPERTQRDGSRGGGGRRGVGPLAGKRSEAQPSMSITRRTNPRPASS